MHRVANLYAAGRDAVGTCMQPGRLDMALRETGVASPLANLHVALREPGYGAPRTWTWRPENLDRTPANLDVAPREPRCGAART